MKILTDPIRAEREFAAVLATADEQMTAAGPLPLLVNGLSGGAQTAFVCEYAREAAAKGQACLILAPDDATAARAAATLTAAGVRAAHYPMRDFILHNITASHGIERERLSVLTVKHVEVRGVVLDNGKLKIDVFTGSIGFTELKA